MIDHVDKAKRSEIMRAVKSRNGPYERMVRSALHRLGYRFRLHDCRLPGRPDIVLPKWRTAVFVHGCYWHRHTCKKATMPKSNTQFWQEKFAKNVERDMLSVRALEALGWRVVIVWQCEIPTLQDALKLLALRLL